jgi:hypothetical protein
MRQQRSGPQNPGPTSSRPDHFGPFADSTRGASVARSLRPEPIPQPAAAPLRAVAVRYVAGAPIIVRGPVTRREYRFSRAEPLQQVARADVEPLLASGYFTREG